MNPFAEVVREWSIESLLMVLIVTLVLSATTATAASSRTVPPAKSPRLVVVTGCDSGIGELVSERITSLVGYQVLSLCLTADGVKKMEDAGVYKAMQCDVTKAADIKRVTEEVSSLLSSSSSPSLWALVNNAGIAPIGYIDWMAEDSFRSAMEVNYFGVVSMTRAILPYLKRTRGARIINVSSMAGLLASPGFGAYAASKHAVEGFSKSLREEMSPWGISVCNINPAFMKTPLITKSIADAQTELQNADADIRSQYPPNVLESSTQLILKVQENPVKVVDAIATSVEAIHPRRNFFVGYQAFVLRLVLLLPAWILAFISDALRNENAGPTREALDRIQNGKF